MKLVVEPTEIAGWQTLVHDAQQASLLELTEELESYLVYMLMRFAGQPELVASVLALEFLENIDAMGTEQRDALRDVGDKCLLFSGLFPGRAKKCRVRVSYFVDLGQSPHVAQF